MTDFDLDRLGDVWRQDPDPAEMEKLRRTAEAVARRARLAQAFDAGLAVVVSVVVLVLALSNPRPLALVVGAAAIFLMLSSSIRQRRLRQFELKSLTGSAQDMLDQSITRIRATGRRTRLALISVVPALIVGIGFGAALDSGAQGGLLARFISNPIGPILLAVTTCALIVGTSIHYFRRLRRDHEELEKLVALRESFRNEDESRTI